MRVALFIFIILFCTTPVYAWDTQDTIAEIAWQALHAADWNQTLQIADNPDRYYELNPIIGRHPSRSRVNWYMGATAILHPIIVYALPGRWRELFQGLSLGITGSCVYSNYQLGLKVAF